MQSLLMGLQPYAPTVDPFAELADEARAAEARRALVQSRWLRAQAAEEASLAGVLVDLCEAGVAVSLRSRSGRTHRGTVSSVGGDFVAVGDALVRLDAVVAVRTDTVAGASSGDRATTAARARDVRLADVLADLAGARRSVVVVPASAADDALRGEVDAVGIDVVTLLLDGDAPRTRCYVPLEAIAEVLVAR
jgi:hypothetical protein